MTQRRIYQNELPYYVTFRIGSNLQFFEETRFAALLSRIIFKTCKIKHFHVIAYQIIPDHVYLLIMNKYTRAHPALGARLSVERTSAGTAAHARNVFTISDVMHGIKSYYCDVIRDKFGINFSIWQKRFYTRIVDCNKYLESVIHYIKLNPVKKGLPSKYHILPYQYYNRKLINSLF